MRRARARSLGRRLSYWLALQSLVGLLMVCAIVYGSTSQAFKWRQMEDLNQRKSLLQHLVSEAGVSGDESMLRHKLEDLLVGNAELGLSLRRGDGQAFFDRPLPLDEGARRTLWFELDSPLAGEPPFAAELSLDTSKDGAVLRRIGLALSVAAVGGAALISIGGFVLVWLGLRPLRDLSGQVSALAADTLHHRLDGSGQPEELAPLIAQFNDLLGRLDRSYEQLEGFNADVAHELLTPLATLRSGAELALRSPQGVDELREVLGSNLEDLQRVAGIVHDMLFLSQADRGAIARRAPLPSLAAMARQVAAYHDAALADAGLHLEVIGDAGGAFDAALLQRALSNLIGNATRYASPGSIVRIRIRESAADEVSVQVENRGNAIDAQALPRLFDRFFRGDPSRNGASKNHGLGLSIVAAIARMHGGRATAASSSGTTAIGVVLKRPTS